MPRRASAAVQTEIPAVSLLDRRPGHAFLSPKRPSEDSTGLADVFPYYAGFSYDWACALLSAQDCPTNAVVLDPWNGSGTTTLAAQHVGFRSVGVDRNPVANVVASLRTSSLIREAPILEASEVTSAPRLMNEDPLLAWFDSESTLRVRAWADSIAISGQDASLALVALFRAVRFITEGFEGSNPTWVRRAKSKEQLVKISPDDFDDLIMEQQQYLFARIREESPSRFAPVQLLNASSSQIPLAAASVDVVLTSPPYLTRIDYAVAYTRELALLGIDIAANRTLRSALMGTTLIRADGSTTPELGPTASNLVKQISEHSSKASSGYYRKQANQYLRDLTRGLKEITRVARSGASLHMVVQDSYYKDVPISLAGICIEEAELRGWQLKDAFPHIVKRSLATLNTDSRKYRKSEVSETVISLRRL